MNPLLPSSSPTLHPNESAYTLATVHHPEFDESSSLLSSSSFQYSSPPVPYGTVPVHPPNHTRRVILNATLKMALIFVLSCILLGGTLWIALPTLDPYAHSAPAPTFVNHLPFRSLERTARCCVYQSHLLTFRISTTSSRSTVIFILSAYSSPTSSLTSCTFRLSVPAQIFLILPLP
jgi:hypothetical protein